MNHAHKGNNAVSTQIDRFVMSQHSDCVLEGQSLRLDAQTGYLFLGHLSIGDDFIRQIFESFGSGVRLPEEVQGRFQCCVVDGIDCSGI